ncbi:hypothetical protein E3P92_01466 [Wallemia ichthyophaga]|uniref:Uncharacterized protein n=2 Tax=Wallemia ichthyophaga TaxID=245174 RepID=A0A4T0II82_WALIC|nr:uncharacterized protein J056_000841 [Wallemia ichthyophaga EXF-994]TIA73963.1 hypothetical protein E3P91_01139 [Wallemia ichthyophaga]EOR00303.1 hypothetical protein J056_000841 [Wallemia ichthyophaga EXF-994]TIA82562.1 hypothetical protein E3P98_01279 [Wallemia ichthyophaga]TIA92469.1 hypothetical protein E3P97_01444 [Wallemia ichthyophaga]TIB01459.1 hypothetical protein E3P95_01281 [Wallemia ichthyophaga]
MQRSQILLSKKTNKSVKILSFGYGVNLGTLGDRGLFTFPHAYFTLKILPPSKTHALIQTKLSSLPFAHNDFGLRFWLYLDAIGRQDGYGLKRMNVAELPLVVITPIAFTSKKAVVRNRLRKRIRNCITSVVQQSMVTARGGADDLILRDWTYVFYPSIVLENGDVHSNDIDRAMINVLKHARNVGLNNTLAVYKENDVDIDNMDDVD